MNKPTDGIQPIFLRCPTCSTCFPWSVSRNESPDCPDCAAYYPMACHQCGLDLKIDGFAEKPLKLQGGNGPRVWGLYCPECAANYDHFALEGQQASPCDRCGTPVPAGELRIRSISSSEVLGMVVRTETQYLSLCPFCAKLADRGRTSLLGTILPVLILIALFVFVCLLLNLSSR